MSEAAPALAPRPKVNKWLVTLSVTFGTLMGAIDASIVNVALPHIRGAVGATVQEITWISTAFALSTVLVMPLTAFLGRLFGQKRVYMLCLCLFLLGSALCGTAHSLFSLIAFRALQGFGAGALQPTEQAILRQTFEPKEQGMAMALFSLAVMVGPAIGPTLGGYITDTWSWQWIFYINLPVGALGLLMVATFVHEDPEILAQNRGLAAAQRKNVDWQGIALLSVGLASLQYFLEEGARDDWFDSRAITAAFGLSVVALIAFIMRELSCPAPAVNVRLFKDRVFLSGTLIGSVMFGMLMANIFLLPVFMQELLGFDATQAGIALMPRALVMMVVTPIIGRIYNHVSPRLLIGVGVLFFCYGAFAMSQMTLQSGRADVTTTIAIQGIGFACLFVPLTTTALSAIPRHLLADATGLNSLFRQVGGSIGLAIFATLLGVYTVDARASIGAHVVITRPEVQARLADLQHGLMARGVDAYTAHARALQALAGGVARQASNLAFDRAFLAAGFAFLLVLPLLTFLKVVRSPVPVESGSSQHVEL
ncbi:MAG: DHA2 family efflux MFS transporter permease subunit [Polyangiales bacterium]